MTMQEISFRIPDMHCEGCTQRITRVLERLEGVRSAEVTLEGKRADVTYDAERTGPDALKAATRKAGYMPVEDATPVGKAQ